MAEVHTFNNAAIEAATVIFLPAPRQQYASIANYNHYDEEWGLVWL